MACAMSKLQNNDKSVTAQPLLNALKLIQMQVVEMQCK